MVGNVYYWGDYLRVEPDYAKQFKDENGYNAWAYPIAKEWYERSFDSGLCAGAITAISENQVFATLRRMSLRNIT